MMACCLEEYVIPPSKVGRTGAFLGLGGVRVSPKAGDISFKLKVSSLKVFVERQTARGGAFVGSRVVYPKLDIA